VAKIVMGYWDCTSCGNAVKGTLRTCPSCGNARGEGVGFYMKEIEYLSEEEAAKIGAEPDWLCEYCGTYNNAKLTHCAGCTAVRGTGNKDYFDNHTELERQVEKDETLWECAYCGAQNPDSADHCGACHAERCEKPKEEKPAEPPKKKKLIWPWVLLMIAILVVGIIIVKNKTTKIGATVNEITYASFVNIEELRDVEHTADSRSDIPSNGTFVRTEEETYTEREQTGSHTEYKDNGNGTFTEVEVPDYSDVTKTRTVYVYTVQEWDVVDKVQKTGVGKDYSFAEATTKLGQRIGDKTVVFTIKATTTEGDSVTYKVYDEALMQNVEVGGTYTFTVRDDRVVKVE